MKKIFLLAVSLTIVLVSAVKAQSPASLYYLENIPQCSFVNPAMAPRANGFIGFPVVNTVYLSTRSDLLNRTFIQENGSGLGYTMLQKEFDHSKMYKSIGEAANFGVNQTLAPIIFGFSGKHGYFTFSVMQKLTGGVNVPKSVFQMVQKGLPLGSNYDFKTLGLNSSLYLEYMAGFSYQLTSQLRVGVHAKLLQGIAGAKTKIDRFNLSTSKEELTADVEGGVYASAPIDVFLNEEGLPDSVQLKEFKFTEDYLNATILNFKNPGFAFDVGAVFDLDEYWSFSASLNDVGFIRWGGDLHSFTGNGKYSFKGLEIGAENVDSIDNVLDDLVDSLKNALNYSYGKDPFLTGLGPQLYLGAEYNLTHYLSFGALSRTVFKKYDFQQEFTLSANLNLYHTLTTTLNFTQAISGANSFGFGLGLRGGPFQFYFLADYFPLSYRNYSIEQQKKDKYGNVTVTTSDKYPGPLSFENFNIMLGFNILFGANGYKDSPMVDGYSDF